MTDLINIGLPKWPALVVHGRPVTEAQAAEIIVRTDSSLWWPCSNDRDWERQIARAIGKPTEKPVKRELSDEERRANYRKRRAAEEQFTEKYGILDLHYLTNRRIASAYVGGPHGWCAWDGTIGCRTYNIGKYPSVSEALEDWTKIAAAFPFLSLTSQLFDREHSEESPIALVEFRVLNGSVTLQEPTSDVGSPSEGDMHATVQSLFMNPRRERGCSYEKLVEALSIAENRTPWEKTEPGTDFMIEDAPKHSP